MTYPFGTAYRFTSSAQHRAYYDAWAATYDEEFAEFEGYDYPRRVAALFRALAVEQDTPIADIGCGTGLVGRALMDVVPGAVVHGFDVSPAMLEVSVATGAYEKVFEVDLTAPPLQLPGGFGAVVSAGAFTLGHLGPEVLPAIMALGRPGAQYVVGVNGQHFIQADFATVLDELHRTDVIQPWQVVPVPIFGEAVGVDPIRVGFVAVFRLRA